MCVEVLLYENTCGSLDNVGRMLQWEWTSECILQEMVRLLIHSFWGWFGSDSGGEGFYFSPLD